MRLHTDMLAEKDVRAALAEAKDAGQVARHVFFEKLDAHGSRTHRRAFEIKLGAEKDAAHNRYTNSGKGGADTVVGHYAATYDEWGWFIARLFGRDPAAKFGGYRGRGDFHLQTRGAFRETVVDPAVETREAFRQMLADWNAATDGQRAAATRTAAEAAER